MKPLSVDILLGFALFTELVCVVGILCSATVYDRLHFSGATGAVAPLLVMAAMIVEQGYYEPSLNAIFDAASLLVLNATLTHATARVARQRERRDVEL